MGLVVSEIDYAHVVAGRRLVADFQPQVWVHDYAMNSADEVRVDVTEAYLRLSPAERAEIRDNDFSSDNLVHAVGLPNGHNGPFEVTVQEAIEEFHAPGGERV